MMRPDERASEGDADMDTTLLATKLRIPSQPHRVVERARLNDALEENIPLYKLLLISAPAGYGKTTMLGAWARASRFPIVWLALGEDDNDLDRLLRYLLAGWEKIQPGVQESPLGLLLSAMEPEREAVLAAFVNAADSAPDHLVFVFDDYHLIDDSTIHEALTFLLDHLPSTIHFVLASRAEPPLPLARYRARHQLLELRADDMRFSLDETADFINHLMRLDFTRDELAALQTRLEGWAAGLRLVALARQRRHTAPDALSISGRQRFIADFLSENVLAQLPEDMRRFLLRTSILDRLCGSLCDAVAERTDSQAMLETLERENLFLVALDDQREWFRYHVLFADFLGEELKRRYPDELVPLHRRAAGWYLAQNQPEPAFRHAVTAGDLDIVAHIFEHYAPAKLTGGEIRVVERWLDALPREWEFAHPIIGFARASILLFTGQVDAGLRHVDEVEQRLLLQGEDTRRQLAMVKALRCIIACYLNDVAHAETYADLALKDLPEDELELRNGAYGALGDTYRRLGRWEEAKACYLKTLDFPHAHVFHGQSVISYGALADLDLRQGHLQGAAAYWEKALAVIARPESWGILPLPLIGWVFTRMGEILYERNELDNVEVYLSRGLERSELSGDVQGMIAGYLLAARLQLTAGDITAADDCLERAQPLVENASFPEWAGRYGRLRLEALLARNRLRAAQEWAEAMMRNDELEGGIESEVARLATARVFIASGDNALLSRALALLERILPVAREQGRAGVAIEALTLQSLACWRRSDHTHAMTALEHALRLAEPEGYARLFADLGLSMAHLLREAHTRDVMPEYVARLLAACGDEHAAKGPLSGSLPEPLSQRELEVLRLIAAGLTNREIAETLVISPETVKKHTGSIYSKLGVGNRTEAASKARELRLLD
jgi:LuxR family transcriptional regulator, maltose regulon positive regulatory protein